MFEAQRDEIAQELTWQMGRPIRYAPNEVRGTLERARHMIAIAPQALADLDAGPKENFKRFVRREPLGVVFTVAAWNYPYLIAVNSVVPALMAGNVVMLKHSAQTPLCAERFASALQEAGLPDGVFQVLHMSHEDTERAIRDPRVDFVAFTGSVAGGHAVQRAAAERFIGVGLELGGCDPVYVRHDANLAHAVENIVDGAYFNSGQSCCGLQRIYVHERLYGAFVDGFVELTRKYVLGNPTEAATTLGPVVRTAAADTFASRSRHRSQPARRRDSRRGLPRSRARHAVSRAAGAARSGSRDAGHARGDLRPRRRHHEGAVGRRGDRADERQRLRADRGDLDRGRGRGARDRRARRDRHLVHEPLRLSRSRARVGRRQGFGPRLHALRRGLRTPDAAEIISPANARSETHDNEQLSGNWNYPTAMRFGAGRIAELPDACKTLGISRPLLVTDPRSPRCR